MKQPDYYLPIMPYLILNDAEGFLKFVKIVFSAEQQMIQRDENSHIIKHSEITIGKAAIMFGNSTQEWQAKTASMFIFVDDVDQIIQKAEANGALIVSNPAQQQFGYSAGFEDPFGNIWWITNDKNTN